MILTTEEFSAHILYIIYPGTSERKHVTLC